MKAFFLGLLIVVGLLAAGLGLRYLALGSNRFFKPKEAAMEREVFEQTPSFVHGKRQMLSRLRLDYERADTSASRESLKRAIQHEAASVDLNLLPGDLRIFVQGLN